ncbi:MAG: bifunctional biotin--[acetyl-CoA-carboxylase] synthetase/biotin operon repressor [Gammaproteobacteria bacterium]|nr:bifunctional biotin--[acetyl-CoA-carboxylase] synthetase/biotin operon repressor [Gammaproteobacteria bacterium]|tara:strand:+ start:233 stop:1228 length:996 start_codon:yes stop_codon:yes gene_type:complete
MSLQPLMSLLADGEVHSGQTLGNALGLSRAGIWKQIEGLRAMGVDVQALPGRGYRVDGGIRLLDQGLITAGLEPAVRCVTPDLALHFSLDSTNAEAARRAAQGEQSCLIMAEHQGQGRGRRGRQWVSPFGRNIYMSLLWPFQTGVSALEGLSLVCALVVVKALRRMDCDGFEVKWPNDILYRQRKLAGILLEISGDVSGPCRVVIGIGVNASMPAGAGATIDQPYSDLAAATDRVIDRNLLASALINELVTALTEFQQQGFAPFRDQWMQLDAYAGQQVEIRAGNHSRVGIAAGVDRSGCLLLDTDQGRETISGGEMLPSLRPVARAQESD